VNETTVRALACYRCGSRERHVDDLYRLRFPDDLTQDNLRVWRDQGATLADLFAAGVRARKLCYLCRSVVFSR
jgi:hypothetical protein